MNATSENPVRVTWTEIEKGQMFVVALCRACRIVRERFIPDAGDAGSIHLIACDALAKAGCCHASSTSPSKASRRALLADDLPVVCSGPSRTTRPPPPDPLPSVREEIGPSSKDPRSE